MAMIIVALVATLAVSMVWQQWRAVQVETAERARAQASWILSGALDWASLILKEDARSPNKVDHLGEPWAVPLAEARLSTFLAADKDNTDDGPEAFLSGAITDAQARFNLRNLVDATGQQVVREEIKALENLCGSLDIAANTATLIADGLRGALSQGTATATANPPLLPKRIDQLTWLGVAPQAIERLEPYVVLLTAPTKVNINTASREVIAAVIPGLNLGDAERIVQTRQNNPFRKIQDIQTQLPNLPATALQDVDISSNFFEVRGRLRLADRVLEQRSLVERSGRDVFVRSREYVSTRDAGS
jgi:general secretion pathway protein K